MNVLKPHVSLNVSNVDASVAFYEKVFGVSPAKRRPGYAKFDLEAPSLNLTMQEAPRSGVNASHFGVQVATTEDVAAAWSRFKGAGLKTFTEENTTVSRRLSDLVSVLVRLPMDEETRRHVADVYHRLECAVMACARALDEG